MNDHRADTVPTRATKPASPSTAAGPDFRATAELKLRFASTAASTIEGLDHLFEGTGQPGVEELRASLRHLLGGDEARGRLEAAEPMQSRLARVHRLRFSDGSQTRSFIVKRLEPGIARRNELVTKRWLPSLGFAGNGPKLIDVAAERGGRCVWHVYEDFGDWALNVADPDPARVQAVVELIAQIHIRFANHPLLAECRLFGGDLGIHFFDSNVRDAVRGLEALRSPAVEISAEHLALRDRLLGRMHQLLSEQPNRARELADLGGPETLLHGDLWTMNTFVVSTGSGWQARLIDWDHAGVGPVIYDLSTFLLRFPPGNRLWILERYREAVAAAGWCLPTVRDLNLLFETAEYARFANRIIWPALALLLEGAEWAFDELAEVEQWFKDWRPVLPINNSAGPPDGLKP